MTGSTGSLQQQNIPIRHMSQSAKEPDFSEGFHIRSITDLLQGQDMIQELHRHDFFYLLALNKGAGHHVIDFVPYPIANDSFFFMRPGQVHEVILKANSTGYLIQFSTAFSHAAQMDSNNLRKASQINHRKVSAAAGQQLMKVLNQINQEYLNKLQDFETVISANLDILFIGLNRQDNGNAIAKINPYLQEKLIQFQELLEKCAYSHKQVSEYADLLHLSVYQLNTITKTLLGKTASELINEYVILEAKRWLLATSSQVNQIAYGLGYTDVSYFSRFFKKHTGYTPDAFRKKLS